MSDPVSIVDETEEERFVYREDGHEAQLVYETDEGQGAGPRLFLLHTEVPEALGGRGIGGQLVRAVVERATRTSETIVPWCPYARKWLKDHPDQTSDITIDWRTTPSEEQ